MYPSRIENSPGIVENSDIIPNISPIISTPFAKLNTPPSMRLVILKVTDIWLRLVNIFSII